MLKELFHTIPPLFEETALNVVIINYIFILICSISCLL